jgi:hypothetical protein
MAQKIVTSKKELDLIISDSVLRALKKQRDRKISFQILLVAFLDLLSRNVWLIKPVVKLTYECYAFIKAHYF